MPQRSSYHEGTPNWVDLQTSDVDAAKAFYTRLFGWSFDDQPMPQGGAYSMAVVVGIGIPVVKYFAALYGAYLVIVGVARAQSFDTVRALLTLLAGAFAGLVIVYALGLGHWVSRVNPLFR